MKAIRVAILICLSCLHLYAMADSVDDLMRDIDRGHCEDAEQKAKRLFSNPIRSTLLGIVAQNCIKDRQSAIYYFSSAARDGEPLAIEKLRLLGIQPPVNLPNIKGTRGAADLDIPLPPPHELPQTIPAQRPAYNAPTTCFPMNQGIGLPPMILCQ